MSGDVALLAVSIAVTAIALLAVASRSIARLAIAKQGSIEDGLVIFALCCSIALTILFSLGTLIHPRARHIADAVFQTEYSDTTVDDNAFPKPYALQILWAALLISTLATPLAKLAILSQYLDFFIWPRYRHASRILLAAVTAFGVVAAAVSLLACLPISAFWDMAQGERCIDVQAFSFTIAIWDLVSNVAILALPMLAVARWSQLKAERLAFTCLYILGVVACTAAALKIYGLHSGNIMQAPSRNTIFWISTAVELNMILICASLPAVGPLIDHLIPGFLANWTDPGRRPSYSRTWLKIKGNPYSNSIRSESPQAWFPFASATTVELRTKPEPQRTQSPLSGAKASITQDTKSSTMVSVTTNKRGSAHPGALVHIPDLESNLEQGMPKPPRMWFRDSARESMSRSQRRGTTSTMGLS
jgi:hypothetical protein